MGQMSTRIQSPRVHVHVRSNQRCVTHMYLEHSWLGSNATGSSLAGRRIQKVRSGVRRPSEIYYINLRQLFPRVTPEQGLQFHVNFKVGLRELVCHILSIPSPEEYDLRLLRKALFPGRCWAVSHARTAFLSPFEPFLTVTLFTIMLGSITRNICNTRWVNVITIITFYLERGMYCEFVSYTLARLPAALAHVSKTTPGVVLN
jgi:hypothetical protein